MIIKSIPIAKINPAPYNPRRDLQPGDSEYLQIEKSVRTFGLVEPLVWNRRTGNLVAGHQRFKVLRAAGATHVDVSVVDLSPAKEKALNLALNRIRGDWDHEKLATLLDELSRVPDLDLSVTGFEAPDVAALVGSLTQPANALEAFDAAAELAKIREPVTKPGDLILLGKDRRFQQRLLCGDCTDPAQVDRLMDGHRAMLMATDPPYLVNYDGTNHPGINAKRKNKDWSSTYGVTWDDARDNPDLYRKFLAAGVGRALAPNAPLYIWHASRRQAMLEAELNRAGVFVHAQIIWAKSRPVLTRSWYLWQHEPCLMGWVKGKKPRSRRASAVSKNPEPMLSTVWSVEGIPNGPERPDHPTPKPIELFAIPIRQHTKPGEIVYEPFAGSGTQIIAAHRLKRRCFATEISPRYCDVIIRRFISAAGADQVDAKVARRYRVESAA